MATLQPDNYEADNQPGAVPHIGCRISTERIFAMSIVSFGIYWIYWMYRTWEQYRDHTGTFKYPERVTGDNGETVIWWHRPLSRSVSYPVWHGLTQLVPIYGWFRLHAHVTAYKNLLDERSVPHMINPVAVVVAAVGILIISVALNLVLNDTGSVWKMIAYIIEGIATGTLIAWMQSSINRYWAEVDSRMAQTARFGIGEVALILLGAVIWVFGILANVLF